MQDLALMTKEVLLAMLTISVLMMGIALFYWKNQAPRINKLYGYRTKRSMQNLTVWRAANAHSSKMCINHALTLLAVAILLSLLKIPYALLIFITILLGGLIYGALRTSIYLKKHFDDQGNPMV